MAGYGRGESGTEDPCGALRDYRLIAQFAPSCRRDQSQHMVAVCIQRNNLIELGQFTGGGARFLNASQCGLGHMEEFQTGEPLELSRSSLVSGRRAEGFVWLRKTPLTLLVIPTNAPSAD